MQCSARFYLAGIKGEYRPSGGAVKSTPVALVKLRGAQLNQARWAWLNHLAVQGGEVERKGLPRGGVL